jgi:hypothetical protein
MQGTIVASMPETPCNMWYESNCWGRLFPNETEATATPHNNSSKVVRDFWEPQALRYRPENAP